jgi:hypothetical protein
VRHAALGPVDCEYVDCSGRDGALVAGATEGERMMDSAGDGVPQTVVERQRARHVHRGQSGRAERVVRRVAFAALGSLPAKELGNTQRGGGFLFGGLHPRTRNAGYMSIGP